MENDPVVTPLGSLVEHDLRNGVTPEFHRYNFLSARRN